VYMTGGKLVERCCLVDGNVSVLRSRCSMSYGSWYELVGGTVGSLSPPTLGFIEV